MKSILDKSFHYTNSASTDVGATFKRIRREQKAKEQAERDAKLEAISKVRHMYGAK